MTDAPAFQPTSMFTDRESLCAVWAAKPFQKDALAIWFEHGRRKNTTFKLTTAILRRFSINRKARYNALRELEQLGLITVRREQGKNPTITVILVES